MNIQDICKVLITVSVVGLIGAVIYALFQILSMTEDFLDHKKNIKEYETIYTYFLNKDQEDYTIDNLIQEVFDNYIIKKGLTDTDRIKEDFKRIMIREISEEVVEYASPFLLKHLTLIYRDKKISQLIYDKVTLLVCAFAAEKENL